MPNLPADAVARLAYNFGKTVVDKNGKNCYNNSMINKLAI
jgi:hypothetical protein